MSERDDTTTLTDDDITTEYESAPSRSLPTPTRTTRTPTLTTPTRTLTTPTRTPTRTTPDAALRRAIEPVDTDAFLADCFERKAPRRARTAGTLRRPALQARRGTADLLTPVSAIRRSVSSRPAPTSATTRPTSPGGRCLLRDGSGRGRRGGVRGRRDSRAPGPPPELDAARGVLARARGAARPPRCRRTRTSRRAGLRASLVHHDTHDVFVLQVAGRKRWLVYEPAVEPAARPAVPVGARRLGLAVLDLVAEAGDTLPAARLAPRGSDVRRGLAPPHRRRERVHVARRAAGRARALRRKRSTCGEASRSTATAPTACSTWSLSGSAQTRFAQRCETASSAPADLSSRGNSPSSGAWTISSRRPGSSDVRP